MAKLKIRVKTGVVMNKVERMSDGAFKIWVKNLAVGDEANKELLSYLKRLTGKTIFIVAGKTTKEKLIEFEDSEREFISKLEKHFK